MDKLLQVEMVTPEKVSLKTQARFVALPAQEGEMGVLPGHEPYLTQLRAGEVRVSSGEETHRFAIAGGFAEIHKDHVSIFAETAEMASEIDEEATRQDLEKAKAQSMGRELDPITLAAAEASIRLALVKLRVAQGRGQSRRRENPKK